MTLLLPALSLLATGALVTQTSLGTPCGATSDPGPDSLAVAEAAAAFHTALAAADTAAVMRLLAPDAIILESGDVESRVEYAQHHLAADIEYARAVPAEREVTGVRIEGGVAWITARTTNRGAFHGRSVASQGAELMILSRADGAWRIRAIHWSSRRL